MMKNDASRRGRIPTIETGALKDLIAGADVFLDVSGPGALEVTDIKKMARDPIVFALANPKPEIRPEAAHGHVAVMATGRSDYPNQINNVLCFPGIFRGALACRARDVNEEMKFAAAYAIAETCEPDAVSQNTSFPLCSTDRWPAV